MKNGFTVTGVKEVQDILDNIAPKHARNLMRATIHGVAGTITKEAKINAPKSKGGGTLKKAIKTKRKKSHPDKPVSEVRVEHGRGAKHDAFYWRFIEYGTSGKTAQAARPFIRPAADRARATFESVLTKEFGKKLEKLLARESKK